VLTRIGVEKSSYHHVSQSEIGSDNPCYQQLECLGSERPGVFALLQLDVSDLGSFRMGVSEKASPSQADLRRLKA
jgi:hypothetical protein